MNVHAVFAGDTEVGKMKNCWLSLMVLLMSVFTSVHAQEGTVRLVDGQTSSDGRVEIFHSSTWGTICDDGFNDTVAEVVCRQLGFHGGTEGSLRLVGGQKSSEGRVEIFHAGHWGTICDDYFNNLTAKVVCQQLGYHGASIGLVGAAFGRGTGIMWMDDVGCHGTESRITDCRHKAWGVTDCGHGEDASVICDVASTLEGRLRLVDGQKKSEGRVEVYHNSTWGTVCSNGFSTTTAQVICQQLGFHGLSLWFSDALFGEGPDRIWLDDVSCNGRETRMTDCSHLPWGVTHCTRSNVASVVCNASNAMEGSIRLAETHHFSSEGRVEIFHSGTWGTVCDDGFNDTFAKVVCRQLGFHGLSLRFDNSTFGKGVGAIWLKNVRCSGQETHVTDCFHNSWGNTGCNHNQDASVVCNADSGTEGSLRLVGGQKSSEGRVEIFHAGHWGTICDDYFNNLTARVVCQQLGYHGASIGLVGAAFGRGTGIMWMDDVGCHGTESRITDCRHKAWGVTDCGHGEDASVICDVANTLEGRLRLADGQKKSEGRVEVYHNSTWGTVCSNGFSTTTAQVICQQLGFHGLSLWFSDALFGEGPGRIWLDGVWCNGRETRMTDCSHHPWGVTHCTRSNVASVVCNASNAMEGSIRLAEKHHFSSEGRVEIFHSGTWGTVCDDGFNDTFAEVVCRQLGFHGLSLRFDNSTFGKGVGAIWLKNVRCSGQETHVTDCFHNSWGNTGCNHNQDASVVCNADSGTEGSLRLVGGQKSSEGRVEIFHAGHWGTICDDYFNNLTAKVVCRQLGYHGASIGLVGAAFGRGTGIMWMDDVGCHGTESRITDCRHKAWGVTDCGHGEDASVICDVASTLEERIRLADGQKKSEGRVEVYHNGTWGTVCSNGFSPTTAQVICQQLGFHGLSLWFSDALFGEGPGRIWLDGVSCNGRETRMTDCSHLPWGITHCTRSNVVSVVCNASNAMEGSIRLAGTHNFRSDGRVEIFHSGTWGTVCDDGFNDAFAEVVCRQLGFHGLSLRIDNSTFGKGVGAIWLKNVRCSGQETHVTDCFHNSWGNTGCNHNQDASVVCNAENEVEGSIRLVNGSNSLQGRVEIFHAGSWGTICDDFFTNTTAQVVCRQLGFHGPSAVLNATGGYGRRIWLDDVQCSGTESRVSDCPHRIWGINNCRHDEDAGVICNAEIDPVRLVNGSRPSEGRVQIFHNGVWGTVCDDNFNLTAAVVVCRQLGYSGFNVHYYSNARYGRGRGPIWMDGFGCSGSERELAECLVQAWGVNDCQHSEDAGVDCHPERSTYRPRFSTKNYFRTTYSTIRKSTYPPRFTTRNYFRTTYSPAQLQQLVTLNCEPERWIVVLDRNTFVSTFGRYDLSHIYLSNAFCPGVLEGNNLVFNYSYSECLTHISVNGSDHMFQNYLVEYKIDPQTGYADRVLWHYDLTCVRPSKEIESLKFAPIDFSPVHVSTSSKVKGHQAFITFYNDSSYTHKMSEPLQVQVGSRVYVEVKANIHDDVKLLVNNCIISPDKSPQLKRIPLVQDRCPANHFVHLIGSSDKVTRFYFEVLEIPHQQNNIYMHCEVSFCDAFDFSSACQNGCHPRP